MEHHAASVYHGLDAFALLSLFTSDMLEGNGASDGEETYHRTKETEGKTHRSQNHAP